MLSGAYSVLHGAPAIVSAVDRFAIADSARRPTFIGDEVRAAFGDAPIPFSDASALRDEETKLGLGSSAAVLVASLAAALGSRDESEEVMRRRLQPLALSAHRVAQGGGSGIDVACSVWGGTLIARRDGEALELTACPLPRELVVEVWASGTSASTSQLLAHVRRLGEEQPGLHDALLSTLSRAADATATALRGSHTRRVIEGLRAQNDGFVELGRAARVPIVTVEVKRLAELAAERGAAVLPSGAGGGDIHLWVGFEPSDPAFRSRSRACGHFRVDLRLQAPGVQLQPPG